MWVTEYNAVFKQDVVNLRDIPEISDIFATYPYDLLPKLSDM